MKKNKIFTLINLLLSIYWMVSASCSNTGTSEKVAPKDTIPGKIATPSKLAILERDLEITKTAIEVKIMEITRRFNELNIATFAATNPKLDSLERQIAREKAMACNDVYKESLAEKKILETKLMKLLKQIDSIKGSP